MTDKQPNPELAGMIEGLLMAALSSGGGVDHRKGAIYAYVQRIEQENERLRAERVETRNAAKRVIEWWNEPRTVGEDRFVEELADRIDALEARLIYNKQLDTKESECKTCGGMGWIYDGIHGEHEAPTIHCPDCTKESECKTCGGAGDILAGYEGDRAVYSTCPDCTKESECKTCGGSGEMEPEAGHLMYPDEPYPCPDCNKESDEKE